MPTPTRRHPAPSAARRGRSRNNQWSSTSARSPPDALTSVDMMVPYVSTKMNLSEVGDLHGPCPARPQRVEPRRSGQLLLEAVRRRAGEDPAGLRELRDRRASFEARA